MKINDYIMTQIDRLSNIDCTQHRLWYPSQQTADRLCMHWSPYTRVEIAEQEYAVTCKLLYHVTVALLARQRSVSRPFLELPVTAAPLYRSILGTLPTGTHHCPIVPLIYLGTSLSDHQNHKIHSSGLALLIHRSRSYRPSPSSPYFIHFILRIPPEATNQIQSI